MALIWYFSMTCKQLGIGFWRSVYVTLYLALMGKDHPVVNQKRQEFAKSFRDHPSTRKIFNGGKPNGQD